MTVNPRPVLAPDSQPWARSLERRMEKLETDAKRNAQAVDNTVKQLASSVQLLSQQVLNLPAPQGYFAQISGFSLAAQRFVQQTITVPKGKTRVVFTAVANVAAVDMTSGGLAVASAYIEANGPGFVWSSPVVPASKDAGASAVNNIISPVLGFEQSDLTPESSFLVSLGVFASNPSAFPTNSFNFATLATNAIFFN